MSVILICGLNGSGKTMFGMKLADRVGFDFLNDEDYYFLESELPFSKSRSEEEAKDHIVSYLGCHKNVVMVATRGDLGESINPMYDCVIYLSAPVEVRFSRIKERDEKRFGERVLPGGDMYEQQRRFHEFVLSRTSEKIEKWLDTLECTVIRLDGTRAVEDNLKITERYLQDSHSWNNSFIR